jgi:outer membrane protein TolC
VAAGLLAAAPAAAQQPIALTFDAAAALAAERHPAMVAARSRSAAAVAAREQAESAWLPRVGVEAQYQNVGPIPTLQIDTGITPPGAPSPLVIEREVGAMHQAYLGARVGWRATDFGARDLRVEAGEQGVSSSEAQAEQTALDVATGARRAYVSWAYFHEVGALVERQLSVSAAELAHQEARLQAGLASDTEVAGARARQAALASRRLEVQQGEAQAAATLCALLGLPEGAKLLFGEGLAPLADRARAVLLGGTHRGEPPELAALERQAHAAELLAESIARSWAPTVDLTASGRYQLPRTFVDTDEAGFAWAAGVALTWSAFDGGLRSAEAREALATRDSLRAGLAAARESWALQAAVARAQLVAADGRLDAARVQLEAAGQFHAAAATALKAGLGTYLDVLRAEDQRDQAEAGQRKAHFDAAMALVDWLAAAGAVPATPPREPAPAASASDSVEDTFSGGPP